MHAYKSLPGNSFIQNVEQNTFEKIIWTKQVNYDKNTKMKSEYEITTVTLFHDTTSDVIFKLNYLEQTWTYQLTACNNTMWVKWKFKDKLRKTAKLLCINSELELCMYLYAYAKTDIILRGWQRLPFPSTSLLQSC